MEREVCLTVNKHLKDNTPVPKASTKQRGQKSFRHASVFPVNIKTTVTANNLPMRRSCSHIQILLQKSWKYCKKKKGGEEKKVHTKAENRHCTKLATSTPLVLSLCPNLLTAVNPGLPLHRNERWILAEWAYWAIVLTGLFWGNFLAYCMKKNILRTEIKWRLLATVGRRRSLGGFRRALR